MTHTIVSFHTQSPGFEILLVVVALQIVLLVHEFDALFLGVVHGDIAGRRDFGVVPLILLHGDQFASLRDRVIHRRQSGGLGVTCWNTIVDLVIGLFFMKDLLSDISKIDKSIERSEVSSVDDLDDLEIIRSEV